MKNSNKKEIKCPICNKIFDEASNTKPFCSKRCSYIDLNNWLDEKYSIPAKEYDLE